MAKISSYSWNSRRLAKAIHVLKLHIMLPENFLALSESYTCIKKEKIMHLECIIDDFPHEENGWMR